MIIIRRILGILLCLVGLVFTIIPGSTLAILAGLMIISIDYPPARRWLSYIQRGMSQSARKLDRFLLQRKLK